MRPDTKGTVSFQAIMKHSPFPRQLQITMGPKNHQAVKSYVNVDVFNGC